MTMPIRLALGAGLLTASHYTDSNVIAWGTLLAALPLLLPRLMVTVKDEDRDALVRAFRDALQECGVSLKAASIDMELHSPADLLHALARERQCDLFFRLCKLPLEVRRTFHFNCVLALGLPTKAGQILKVAAAIEPMTAERSA